MACGKLDLATFLILCCDLFLGSPLRFAYGEVGPNVRADVQFQARNRLSAKLVRAVEMPAIAGYQSDLEAFEVFFASFSAFSSDPAEEKQDKVVEYVPKQLTASSAGSLLADAPKRELAPLRVVGASDKVVWDAVLERNKEHNELYNGIRFKTRVTSEKGQIRITWEMVYEGPRWPLVILEPSLDGDYDHTEVRIFARGKNGTVHDLVLMAPHSKYDLQKMVFDGLKLNPVKRSRFLIAEKNQTLRGDILLNAETVVGLFERQWPAEFDRSSLLLAIQLIHMPMDRGDEWDLDAWTGRLAGQTLLLKKKMKHG